MDNFVFTSPTTYFFGKDAELKVGSYLSLIGVKKVLMVSGKSSAEKSGLLGSVREKLDEAGIRHFTLLGVVPNPRDDKVYEGIKLCRENQVDFVLGVGGGSSIDTAKAIAVGVPYDGDFWDFYAGTQKVSSALKIGTIITLPATGSEGSNSSVITKLDGMVKRGLNTDFIRPTVSFLNPELTFSLPPYQTAAGITDMLAHIMERYLSTSRDVDLTDRMCEAVMKSIIKEGKKVIENPLDYEARANIFWSGTVAHNNILGVGRVQDWSSHLIEHELSALYDVTHGAGLAVVMPNFMRYTVDQDVNRFAQFAVRVFDVEPDFYDLRKTALEGIDRLAQFFHSIGMPLTFGEIGAKEEDIPLLASKVRRNNKDKVGFFKPLSSADVEAIYRLCL